MKKYVFITLALIGLFFFTVLAYFYSYRFRQFVKIKEIETITHTEIEGYTNKLSYAVNDTVKVFTKASSEGVGYVQKIVQNKQLIIDSFYVELNQEKTNYSQSEFGCNWSSSHQFILTNYSSGYYAISFVSDQDTSVTNFLIENKTTSKIAVLMPTSTWVAYNDWGGKSLYVNHIDSSTVYHVSTQRPTQSNDVFVENNITDFFMTNYDAIVLPDYALEYETDLLADVDVIVLAFHCEYFSEKMYKNLQDLIHQQHKSFISLGANQIYWKVKWNQDYTKMECRKDLTSFEGTIFDYGGMWKHHFQSEEHLLGVRFTDAGMHSYAPYQVVASDHWIFEGTNANKGDMFGEKGINKYPISGDETDKIVSKTSNMTLLAKGLNCSNEVSQDLRIDDNCDLENAGADFIIIENESYNILSTGSIQSGSGLNHDAVFTQMIKNFIQKSIKN